jgi:hypothetical protein
VGGHSAVAAGQAASPKGAHGYRLRRSEPSGRSGTSAGIRADVGLDKVPTPTCRPRSRRAIIQLRNQGAISNDVMHASSEIWTLRTSARDQGSRYQIDVNLCSPRINRLA